MTALPLYLATAAIALFAVDRWLRPMSRWAALVLALAPCCLMGKALLLGRVYAPIDLPFGTQPLRSFAGQYDIGTRHAGILSDLWDQTIPWHHAVRHAWSQGEFPLWNPFALCGDILAGSAQAAPYHPINLLSLLVALPQGITYMAACGFFFAALGMFVFLRGRGIEEPAALLGAAGWALSDFLVFWIGWALGISTAILPMVLCGVQETISGPRRRGSVVLTAAFVWLLLAGHPETAVHVVFVAGLFALYELWTLRSRRDLGRAVGGGVAAGVAALLLCALYLLPIVEVLPQSHEHAARKAVLATMDRARPAGESASLLLLAAVPFAYGLPGLAEPAAMPPHAIFALVYAGAVLLPFALLGLWRSGDRLRWWLAAAAGAGLLAGVDAPLFANLLAKLPLLDIAINSRLVFAAVLAVSVLSALGAQVLGARWNDGAARDLARCALVLLAAEAVACALAWRAMASNGLAAGFLATRAFWLLAPLAAVAAAATFLRRPLQVSALALLLLLAGRAAEVGGLYPSLPEAAFFPRVSPLTALPETPEPYRTVGTFFAMVPNTPTLWNLEDVRGYQALRFSRLVELIPLYSTSQDPWFNRVDDLSRPLLSFLNVRFAVSDSPTPPGWTVVAQHKKTSLLRNPRALPRVFVPAAVRLGGSAERVRAQMAEETDFGARAWIEDPARPDGEPEETGNGRGTLHVRRDGTGLAIDAQMRAGGWLVASETAWKGWRAVVDGQEVPLRYANRAFLAFEVPKGKHRIRLFYRPRSFEIGLAVSLATALGLLVVAWRLGRRPRLGTVSAA